MEQTPIGNGLHNFTLSEFQQSISDMIATSESSYKSPYGINRVKKIREYTNEELKKIIEAGTVEAQRELSYNYFSIDGMYRRIIIHYATLLTYQGILIPSCAYGVKIKDKAIQKRYYKALDFIDNMDIQSICIDFAFKALVYGCYYGVIQTLDKENFAILDLPISYCFSRYKDKKNNDIIEFDLQYFNTLQEGSLRDSALSAYPPEIAAAYRSFKEANGPRYYMIPSEIGICFPLFDCRPFFLSSIPDLVDYRDYKEMEKVKDSDEIKKILIQKIPHLPDGTLLFEPPEALEMHKGAVGMMSNNKNISVLTTYSDVDVESSSSVNESISKNNLEKSAQNVYRTAGVSSQLFASQGNMSLNTSVQNDLALMMSLATKFSRFFTNIVNRIYGNSQIQFKYTILPISRYKNKDNMDRVYKGASNGYSFILPAIASGLSQKDLVDIKKVENEILKLSDLLIPLKTSYTETSNDGAGRPELPDEDKSDKTIKNIESKGNGGGGETQ